MPRIFAFDPGIPPGFAVIEDGSILHTRALSLEEVLQKNTIVPVIEFLWQEDTKAIAEQGPGWGRNNAEMISKVESYLRDILPYVEWYTPSQWKSTLFKKRRFEWKMTQHEKDAVRMALWFEATLKRRKTEKGV